MRILVSFLALAACLPAADTLPITGLAHVGFRVSDMETARAVLYRRAGLSRHLRSEGFRFWQNSNGEYILQDQRRSVHRDSLPGLLANQMVRFTHPWRSL